MPSSAESLPDMSPSPRAVIDLDPADLDPATATVTIHQLSRWGDIPVRGYSGRALVGGLVATDYEIPLGVDVTYRVEQFDESGDSRGFALALPARIDMPDTGHRTIGKVVVQDPLAPARAILLDARPGSFAQLEKRRDLQIYDAGTTTLGLAGLRTLLKDVPFIFTTDTEDQREQLDAILASSVILIRAERRTRLPGLFYAAASSIQQIPHDPSLWTDIDDWSFAASEITRPVLAVVVALISYQLFQDFVQSTTAGTYDDAASIWATYLDALRNPPEIS